MVFTSRFSFFIFHLDLYGIRGTFITLNLLFRESTFKSSLASSTIYINGSQHHVASSVFNDGKNK